MNDESDSLDLLIVMSHMGNGGAQRVVSNMLPLWIEQDVKVCLILGNSGPRVTWAYDIPKEVRVIEHERWVPKWSIFKIAGLVNITRSFLRLRREIRRLRPPVVLSLICPANIKTILACAGLGIPRVVVSERNNPARQEFPVHVRLGRRLLYRYASVVTANSEGACAWLKQIAPGSAIEYLPNPVEVPSTVDRPMSTSAGTRLIYVGRLVPQKRVRELIQVLAERALKGREVMLTMVGSGPERESLQKLACTLGVDDSVEFVGQVADVRSYYQNADIFVLLSRYEGMPNALLEAMAWKIAPIVSEEVHETTCLIDHGKNGMVLDGQCTSVVAEVIRELADDADLRGRLADEARMTALVYSMDRVFREWNRILGMDRVTRPGVTRVDPSVES